MESCVVKKLMGLQLSSLIMGVIALISFVTVYSLIDSFNWVDHTHDVIYQLHRCKDDLSDMQTSVREAIFSDNEELLTPYIVKAPLIEGKLDNLQWLTRDNVAQQENIYGFRQNVNRRLTNFREAVSLFNDGKTKEAQEYLKGKFGEPWSASTRNLAEIIESEELRLLELRLRDYKQKSSLVLYGIPLLMILYVVIFNSSSRFLVSKI